MKILVIAPTPFFSNRGTHIRILEESLALEKIGHDITIATYHIGSNIEQKIKTKIDVRRIRRLLFWYTKLEAGPDWQKIILDLMLLRKVFYLARTQKPDILHAHLHEGVLIGWMVKKLLFWRKMKLVADFHGSLTKEMVSHAYLKSSLLNKFFYFIEKTIDNMGDKAIASSWENAQELSQIRKGDPVETVPDGVNLNYYKNLPAKEESKKALEFPLDKTIITYTGALVPNKGTSYLFDAIKIILSQKQNIFFVLGGFPIVEAEAFVKINNFKQSIRLIHPLDYFQLPEILNASDIGIDPKDSSVKQASGKILQYMGAGLPVVCFDRQNNREYLENGGAFAEKITATSLAKAAIRLMENPEEIIKKGELNKKRAEEFSWMMSAKKINNLYNTLCPKIGK